MVVEMAELGRRGRVDPDALDKETTDDALSSACCPPGSIVLVEDGDDQGRVALAAAECGRCFAPRCLWSLGPRSGATTEALCTRRTY